MTTEAGARLKLTAINSTCIGASHIRANKVCQDASACINAGDFALAVVSDGHGDDPFVRSDKGAAFAVEAAKWCVSGFLAGVNPAAFLAHSDGFLTQLAKSIISDWNDRVRAHFAWTPFTEAELRGLPNKLAERYAAGTKIEEAYGATLLVAVATEQYWFGLHIGDGKCVVCREPGKFGQPIPWDEKCVLNATTSICSADAIGSFRYFFSEETPDAIFVASDGIDDCFSNDAQLYDFYEAVLALFGQYELAAAKAELAEYLPKMSAAGSGDDMSVAAILDIEKLLHRNGGVSK